ncbi:MAG: H-type lectin domain-containing protein [Melioribacteraceae bacterium]|nr:H-type lectin domain-containing protein [Melioribacteraceae bacterium]
MRNLFFILFISLFVNLNGQSFVQTGEFSVEKTKVSNYMLDSGSDQERTLQLNITFPKQYKNKPEVMLSVTKFDGEKGINTRYSVKLLSVHKAGFSMEIKTWGGSKIYMIGGMWMAIGE